MKLFGRDSPGVVRIQVNDNLCIVTLHRVYELKSGEELKMPSGYDEMTERAHVDYKCANAEALKAIVERHPQVERILCGHLHRPIQVRWAGTLASTSPSPAHQVALDLSADAPSQFVMEPPGYQLHRWHAESGLVSHTAFIGKFDGPYPFHDGDGLIE